MALIRAIVKWLSPRRRMTALALIGWVGLVIIGAGGAPTSDNWVNVPDLGGLIVLSAAVAAVLGLVLLISMRPATKGPRGPVPERSSRLPLLAVLVFVLLLIAFAPKQDEEGQAPVDTQAPVAAEENRGATATEDGDEGVESTEVIALLLVGVIAAGVVLYTARRGALTTAEVPTRDDAGLTAALGPAFDAAIERLRVDGEPRAAVIAAYAGLEKSVADSGYPRRPAETPTEHMSRALAAIPAVAYPAVRLGALYEVARFSDHPIGEGERRQAAAALDQARSSLGMAAAHAP